MLVSCLVILTGLAESLQLKLPRLGCTPSKVSFLHSNDYAFLIVDGARYGLGFTRTKAKLSTDGV
jgi:hypothetical protein